MTAGQYIDALARTLALGAPIEDVMRADERAAGNRIVRPGDEPWFSISDWHPSVVVSISGKRVRLVAILAQKPRNGSLHRLVTGIQSAGLIPVIIEPTNELRSTLKRWNWKCRRKGLGFSSEEQWCPRRDA